MVQSPQPPKLSQKSKASWNSLPTDVKRYALQFIASSNVYEVAETMKVLSATNRFCHAAMQSEQVVISIMERMPYIANRTSLLYQLYRWPVREKLKRYENAQWHRLRNGGELLDATRANNIERVKELLTHEDLQLNCHTGNSSETSLALALDNGCIEIAVGLIKAGAIIEDSALFCATRSNKIQLVKLLLEYGADPTKLMLRKKPLVLSTPEIRKLVLVAQINKRKRMRLLCGKKF